MKLRFENRTFYTKSEKLLTEIDAICQTYYANGYVLTLRQLYYQLVSRNRIANTEREYKNLGKLVRDGRYAGVLDWEHIQDRLRMLKELRRWEGPEDRMHSAAETYRIDTWEGQEYRPEVWIEKDALLDIASRPCDLLDVPYIAVKAYNSASACWEARKRFREYLRDGQKPLILHLGDLDCTGDDCSRFLLTNMETLTDAPIELRRLALNPEQVEKYQLPPQPGKSQDPRFRGYVKKHGTTNVWELDALAPDVIAKIIEDGIRAVMDDAARGRLIAKQEAEREVMLQVSTDWEIVVPILEQRKHLQKSAIADFYGGA